MRILDIETLSIGDADAYLEPVEAPANYRDPAKIDAYKAEKRAELLARAALDPDLCQIAVVSWLDDGATDPIVLTTERDAERDVLTAFWKGYSPGEPWVGFNLLAFDLPVLIRRSQYLGVHVPNVTLDKYRTPHIDLMQKLSFNGVIRAHSLDFYCRRFGVALEDPYCGKDVAALIAAGNWTAVIQHCRCDVLRTRALAERLGILQGHGVAV